MQVALQGDTDVSSEDKIALKADLPESKSTNRTVARRRYSEQRSAGR